MKIDLSKAPYENCSLFDKCECNRCILHPNFDKLQNSPEDISYYHKCRAGKPARKEIAAAFGLKNRGLYPKELLGLQKWENMSQSEKDAKLAKLAKNSPFLQLKSKGYAITRVGKDDPQFTLSNDPKTPNSSVKNPCSNASDPQKTLFADSPVVAGDFSQNKIGDAHEKG